MSSPAASAVGDDGKGRGVCLDVSLEVLPPSALDCRAEILALEKPLCEVEGKILDRKKCIAAGVTQVSTTGATVFAALATTLRRAVPGQHSLSLDASSIGFFPRQRLVRPGALADIRHAHVLAERIDASRVGLKIGPAHGVRV